MPDWPRGFLEPALTLRPNYSVDLPLRRMAMEHLRMMSWNLAILIR